MFQSIDILFSIKTAVMLRNTLPLEINGYSFRTCYYRNLSAAIGCRNGVVIGVEADSTEPVYSADSTLGVIAPIKNII